MADPSLKAFALGAYFLQKSDNSQINHIAWQMDHRLELVQFWDIKPDSRILELGCGQGDATVVLADAVGEHGHIDAVDPGTPDYGAPFTLSQAQEHIKNTVLGPRISFHLSTDPVTFLSSLPQDSKPYDYVVLSHCSWYFESPATLSSIITASIKRTTHLCIAEWSLRASTPSSQPHVLTALLLASLEAKRHLPSSGNIRTVLSPTQTTSNIEASKAFKLRKQDVKVTNQGMLDGYWETSYVLRTREKVLGRLREQGVPEAELTAMSAMYDAVEAGVGLLEPPAGEEEKVKGVRSMDFWVAVFSAV